MFKNGNSSGQRIRDVNWVQHSFMLAGGQGKNFKELARYRNLSTADFSFEGTGFGQSLVINPAPQFTPFADIRKRGLWTNSDLSTTKTSMDRFFQGMGRAYHEMIVENRQVVHIRFGVTQYKGLVSFFTGFYDNGAAILARQGRASIAYYLGLGAASLATIWLQPLIVTGAALKYILGRSSSKYMDLKPTMPLYWQRVNVIMNSIGANLGVIPRTLGNTGHFNGEAIKHSDSSTYVLPGGDGGVSDLADLKEAESNESYKTSMYRLFPGGKIFAKDGRLDVQRAVLEGARRQLEYNKRVNDLVPFLRGGNKRSEVYKVLLDHFNKPLTGKEFPSIEMKKYLELYHGNIVGSLKDRNLDGDNIGDMIETAASSGDVNELYKLSGTKPPDQNANTNEQTENQTNATNLTGDAAVDTNNAFVEATAGTGEAQTSATEESQQPPADTAEVSGIDEEALRAEVYKRREREMLSTIQTIPGASFTDAEKAEYQQAMAEGKVSKYVSKMYQFVTGWMTNSAEVFEAEWNNGSAFLNLAVNYTGAGSMNISNQTKETTIAGTLKNVSGAARDSRISLSDFKTGFSFIDGAITMVSDVFGGALDAVSMSGIMALAGNAFVDFPKQWEDSSATVPTANFTIELRSFTGNRIADYLYLYTTVACLLAGATPLSTGPQSYTAPFVCEAYCQGQFAIRYGMISSINIRHATGNLGMSANDRRPLAFDIDVEIADLSSVYHASISNGMSPINIFKRVFDDDNTFNDYLSTISGLQLEDMVNPKRKLALALATQMANVKSWWSPTHIASRIAGTTPIQVANKIFGPTTYAGT